jgi:hypothetical protein
MENRVLPLLIRRVFHVTNAMAFSSILLDGAIKANMAGELTFSCGQSENSFFRKRGYVSVCDLRSVSDAQISESLMKYNFLNPSLGKDTNVYLFLRSACFDHLLTWRIWHEEKAYTDMVVPHIEAGYPGEIGLNLIESALYVDVENRPITK